MKKIICWLLITVFLLGLFTLTAYGWYSDVPTISYVSTENITNGKRLHFKSSAPVKDDVVVTIRVSSASAFFGGDTTSPLITGRQDMIPSGYRTRTFTIPKGSTDGYTDIYFNSTYGYQLSSRQVVAFPYRIEGYGKLLNEHIILDHPLVNSTQTISTDYVESYQYTVDKQYDDNVTKYYPDSGGTTLSTNDHKYWRAIGNNEFLLQTHGHILAHNSDAKLYFQTNSSGSFETKLTYHADDEREHYTHSTIVDYVDGQRFRFKFYGYNNEGVFDGDYVKFYDAVVFSKPIDTTHPYITDVFYDKNVVLGSGDHYIINVKYNEIVTFDSGATPYMPISVNGGSEIKAYYLTGSGTDILSFLFAAPAGYSGGTLSIANSNLDLVINDESITDIFGNTVTNYITRPANINSDGTLVGSPIIKSTLTSITDISYSTVTTSDDKYIKQGDKIKVTVKFDRAVKTHDSDRLSLSNGSKAYASSTGYDYSDTHEYIYTVSSDTSETSRNVSFAGYYQTTFFDEYGNYSCTNPTSFNSQSDITVDNKLPVLTLTNLTDMSSGFVDEFTAKINATDDNLPTNNSYIAYLSSDPNTIKTNILNQSTTFTADGTNDIYYKVTDRAGNTATQVVSEVKFDKTAPSISIIKDPNLKKYPEFDLVVTDTGKLDRIDIKWVRKLSTDPYTYEYLENSSNLIIQSNYQNQSIISFDDLNRYEGKIKLELPTGISDYSRTEYLNGEYTAKITVYDAAGNNSTSWSGYIMGDNMKPEIDIVNEDVPKKAHIVNISSYDRNIINENIDGVDGTVLDTKYVFYDIVSRNDSEIITSPNLDNPLDGGTLLHSQKSLGESIAGVITSEGNKNSGSVIYDFGGKSGIARLEVFSYDIVERDEVGNPLDYTYQNANERNYCFLTFDNHGPNISSFNMSGNSQRRIFDISLEDNYSNIKSIKYCFLKDGVNPTDTSYISILDFDYTKSSGNLSLEKDTGTGSYKLHLVATDSLDNETYYTSDAFAMETSGSDATFVFEKKAIKTNLANIHLSFNSRKEGITNLTYSLSEDNITYLDSVNISDATTTKTFTIPYAFNVDDNFTGTKELFLKITEGIVETVLHANVYIDRIKPTAEVSYSTNDYTNADVVATLNNITDDYSVTQNIATNTDRHTFISNGNYTFVITDEAGNTNEIVASVDNIIKTPPIVTFSPNGMINNTKSVDVTLGVTHNEVLSSNSSYSIIDEETGNVLASSEFIDGDVITLDYALPVRVRIQSVDSIGNESIVTSNVFNVDNTPPKATVEYSHSNYTSSNVLATITFNEETIITNNLGSNVYTFTENSEFIFTYVDSAGNSGTTTVSCDLIDRTQPIATIEKAITELTTSSVEFTVSTLELNDVYIKEVRIDDSVISPVSDEITEDIFDKNNALRSAVYLAEDNCLIQATVVYSKTGEEATIYSSVGNIDKNPPIVSHEFLSNKKSNDSVKAVLSIYDAFSTKDEMIISVPNGVETIEESNQTSYKFIENGTYTFNISDKLGNSTTYDIVIDLIDREINPVITYSETNNTNQDITVYVEGIDGEPIIFDETGTNEYIVSTVTDTTLTVRDEAGNSTEVHIFVDWINKDGYDYNIIRSNALKTNESIVLTIIGDEISSIESVQNLQNYNNQINAFECTENGTYSFVITDTYGNQKQENISVFNIDKTPVDLTKYELILDKSFERVRKLPSEDITDVYQTVTVLFDSEDEYTLTSFDENLEYDKSNQSLKISENGTYEIEATDIAGNKSTITIVIDYIDDTSPEAFVSYSITEPTNQIVIATVSSNEEIIVLNNNNNVKKAFSENGSFVFEVSDSVGNITEVTATVNNIFKTPPNITIIKSTSERTNENIILSISGDREFFILNKSSEYEKISEGSSYDFEVSKNGRYSFEIKDSAGNEITVTEDVYNIDKTPPEISFFSDESINLQIGNGKGDLLKYAYSDDTYLESFEVDSSNVDFNTAGIYTVTYTAIDDLGNISVVNKNINIIDLNGEFSALLNGQIVNNTNYILNAHELVLEVMNNEGEYNIYYLEELTSITKVKETGILLSGNVIKVSDNTWLTIYLVDKHQNKEVIKVYLSK